MTYRKNRPTHNPRRSGRRAIEQLRQMAIDPSRVIDTRSQAQPTEQPARAEVLK